MSEYEYMTVVGWKRNDATFAGGCYSRDHYWLFDGGAEVHCEPVRVNVPPGMRYLEAVS